MFDSVLLQKIVWPSAKIAGPAQWHMRERAVSPQCVFVTREIRSNPIVHRYNIVDFLIRFVI